MKRRKLDDGELADMPVIERPAGAGGSGSIQQM